MLTGRTIHRVIRAAQISSVCSDERAHAMRYISGTRSLTKVSKNRLDIALGFAGLEVFT